MFRLRWLVGLMILVGLICGAVYYFAHLADEPTQVFKGQNPIVSFLPISDGFVVVAEADGGIHLVDSRLRQKPQLLLKAESPMSYGAVSTDQKRFAMVLDGTTKYRVSVDGLRSVESTPDSQKSEVIVWDSATYKQIGKLRFEGKRIVGLAFSKDSSIVVFLDRSGKIYHWTVESDKCDTEHQLCNENQIRLAALSRDATLCATASDDGKVTIFDAKQLKKIRTVDAAQIGNVSSLAFSPNGAMLAIGYTYGSIVVFETTLNGRKRDYFIGGSNPQLSFASDGKTVFIGADLQLKTPSYQVAMISAGAENPEPVGVIKRKGILRHVGVAPDNQLFYWSVDADVFAYPEK